MHLFSNDWQFHTNYDFDYLKNLYLIIEIIKHRQPLFVKETEILYKITQN